ncbi:MAG: hypothetical protein JO010_01715 [Alphaproteobacteria bacterium]|nr:hypothetical protein [Alphaproteobacteria bacterium]
MDQSRRTRNHDGVQLPLILLALAFFLMVAFQGFLLMREQGNLAANRAAQEGNIQEAGKLRQQAEGLGAATAKLADSGNSAVKTVIEELRRQGINVKSAN